jgi:hypothetical protein
MYNANGSVRFTVEPFGSSYTGGVRVAVGDVTGDGVPDVVVATGGRTDAEVEVINGATGSVWPTRVFTSTTYAGPVSVAVGDVNGDGIDDIAVGTNERGPRVRLFEGGNFAMLSRVVAGSTTNFRGNTQVALADVNHDGKADLIVSSLYTTGSRVASYTGTSLLPGGTPTKAFNAFMLGGAFTKGLFLAAGDVNSDGFADLIFGAAPGQNPVVLVESGQNLVRTNTRKWLDDFTPAGSNSTTGLRVAMGDITGAGAPNILTSSGGVFSAFEGGILPATGTPPLLLSLPLTGGGIWVG